MKQSEFIFSELERFTIQNTPAIIDSLAATYNRVADLFEPTSQEIEKYIDKITKKKGWTLDSSPRFAPFGFWPGTRKRERLDASFQYCAGFNLKKEIKGKKPGYVGIDFGYYFGPAEIPDGYFYFNVYTWGTIQFGPLQPLAFYQQLAKSVEQYSVQVSGPNHENETSLEISYPGADAQKIRAILSDYQVNIVVPFLDGL